MTQLTMWKLYYENESQLLESVKNLDMNKFELYCNDNNITAYRYILGVNRALNSNHTISNSQLNLIKSMAKYIHRFEKILYLICWQQNIDDIYLV